MKLEIPNTVELITLGLKCPKCGATWGLRLDRFAGKPIPATRYICEKCYEKEQELIGDSNEIQQDIPSK